MVKDSRKSDPTKSNLWKVFDALLVRQVMPDIETIFQLGDPEEFSHWLRREVPDAWLDKAELPYRSIMEIDLVEQAAAGMLPGIDRDALGMVFLWRRNRRRTIEHARLIRDHADRLTKQAASRARSA